MTVKHYTELIAWLNTKDGEWINADVKVSQGGKWYANAYVSP